MVDAWRHLWVGFAVITNRIARDDTRHKYNIEEISELNNKEYMLVMQKLFNDFQEHNALRFGSETAGVPRKKELREFGLPVFDEEGNKLYEKFDPDKPPTALELGRRALRVGYETTGPKPVKNSQNTNGDQVTYMHTAGKISPEELRQLRREFFSHMPLPEEFYTKVGGMKNIPSTLENIGK